MYFFKFSLLYLFSFSLFSYENADTNKIYNTSTITITASKAQLGKSPVPFAELNRSEIMNFNTNQDLPIMLSSLPSIIFTSQSGNGIGYNSINMRGFDQRRIAVMINGVPQNDPEDHNVYWIDFPDITSSLDNIQVQRGSGLSNYGSAAIGGSINLTTSNFINQKGIKITTGLGIQEFGCDCGKTIFQGISNKQSIEYSSGLNNNYAFYGRLSRISSLGYRERSDANLFSYHFSAVRFDENLSTQINIFGGPFTDGLVYNGIPKSYIKDFSKRKLNPAYSGWFYNSTGDTVSSFYDRRKEEREEFSQPHFEIINDWQINNLLNFKNTAFFYTGDGYYISDASWADTTTLRLTSENGIFPTNNPQNTLIKANVTNKHWGIIPQLELNITNHQLFIGGELRWHRSEHWGKIDFAENTPQGLSKDYKFYSYNGERDIYSIFIRDNFSFLDKFTLSLELQNINHRYSILNEKSGNHFTQYTNLNGDTIGRNGEKIFDIWYNFINPKIALNYKLNEEMNYYIYFGMTSREPRMKNIYEAEAAYYGEMPLFQGRINKDKSISYDFNNPLVKEEKMIDIELGGNYLLNNFDKISLNFYYMDYKDELVKSGKLDIFGNPKDGNVPRTNHLGIELEFKYLLMKNSHFNLFLNSNLTYSQNRIKEYDFITNSGDIISLKDNPIAGFPDLMSNIGIYLQNEKLFTGLIFKYVGESRSDNFGELIKNNPKIIEHLTNDWSSGYYSDNILDSYYVLNFICNYKMSLNPLFKEFKIQLNINNITNNLYATSAEGKEFFVAAERAYYLGFEFNF